MFWKLSALQRLQKWVPKVTAAYSWMRYGGLIAGQKKPCSCLPPNRHHPGHLTSRGFSLLWILVFILRGSSFLGKQGIVSLSELLLISKEKSQVPWGRSHPIVGCQRLSYSIAGGKNINNSPAVDIGPAFSFVRLKRDVGKIFQIL